MKRQVLHVGNILNNGYLHCKYLRARGVVADNLNVDYTHCQGQPEWCEARINTPVAHWDQDWSAMDLGDFVRPDWYLQTTTAGLAELAAALGGAAPSPSLSPSVLAASLGGGGAGLTRLLRGGLRRCRLDGIARRGRHYLGQFAVYQPDPLRQQAQALVEEYGRLLPEAVTPLTVQDVLDHMPRALAHAPVFAHYPLIQGYSLDPIHALLGAGDKPFICYEHGTMRDFPYEDSSRGRLYALALKKAEKVFITNVDCIASARRLGLENWVFIPHLIDDDRFKPAESPERQSLLRRFGCDHLILCPARHHWKHSPDTNTNSWFKANDVLIRGLAKFFQDRPAIRAHAIFFEWGMEVGLSKALIQELGIADRVHWEPIRSKLSMLDLYNAADVVCDQFHPGMASFGAVVPEGLACGKPVISNLDRETNSWGFPVLPPVLHAINDGDVHQALLRLFDDPEQRLRLGAESLSWYQIHHSSKLVIDRMMEVYAEIFGRHGWNGAFD